MGSELYKQSGVDTAAGQDFVEQIKPMVKEVSRPEVMTGVGGFAGLFALNQSRYKDPVLVSGTDGVGTKLSVAQMADVYNTVGVDLVAMCVNDILVTGAEPLFFLDYLAVSSLGEVAAAAVVEGVVEGCRQSGCALLGGETAEMPGLYRKGDFDLAGFAVGVVDREKIVERSGVRVGDVLIGLASTGFHSNGYSLVRKIFFEQHKYDIQDTIPELGTTLADALLAPTRIYVKPVLALLKQIEVHAMAHITGGGFYENLPRSLPDDTCVRIQTSSWSKPAVFPLLQRLGKIPDREMFDVFNCGIGFVLFVPEEQAETALQHLAAHDVQGFVIGQVARQDGDEKVILES